MEYLPGIASLAATNRSKVKNIRLNTLRDTRCNSDARSVILSFEAEAKKHDQLMLDKVESKSIHIKCNIFMPHPMSQVRTLTVIAILVILTYASMELGIISLGCYP